MEMDLDWKDVLMSPDKTLKQAACNLEKTSMQIVIVISEDGFFQGTVTDGDIRRALLQGLTLDCNLEKVMNSSALVAPPQMDREAILHLMTVNRLHQVPIVDAERRVMGLHLLDDLLGTEKPFGGERPNVMIIMAGGLGSRLWPYTETCPKPMLLVDDKPMLEHIIERAKREGFCHFILAIRYLGHKIEEYFGNGKLWGVNIGYLREEEPLGTAGALSFLYEKLKLPFIVSNGDVLTDIRYGKLLDFHIQHKALATMAVQIHELQHPFGIVEVEGLNIVGLQEKPVYRTTVNTGVYAVDPSALQFIKKAEYCDMPTLFERLYASGRRTVAYPIHEPWLDVGYPDDWENAKQTVSFHDSVA